MSNAADVSAVVALDVEEVSLPVALADHFAEVIILFEEMDEAGAGVLTGAGTPILLKT